MRFFEFSAPFLNENMEDLETWILIALPNNGEWWSDGYEAFVKSAEKMLKAGMDEQEIREILSDCYNAVAEEFGS